MSELRKDPVLNRWVIVAPDRPLLRSDIPPATPPEAGPCPFCPGQEGQTPPEIRALSSNSSRAPNSPDWSLRVVPNRFPFLRVEGELNRRSDGRNEALAGIGAHEIIVETPRHDADLADLTPQEVGDVLWSWSERLRDLSQDVRLLAGLVFRNHGAEAGAHLAHPHSQLIAFPIVPPTLATELTSAAAYFQAHRRCGHCDVVRQEASDGPRLVLASEHAVVVAPWASRRPFELVLMPRIHGACFEREPREIINDVAALLRRALRRMNVALERPAWSLVLHTAPLRDKGIAHYHWHIEVLPIVGRDGGLEVGSGCYVNPVPPEEAAAFLRNLSDD